jgi:hypothetical protein
MRALLRRGSDWFREPFVVAGSVLVGTAMVIGRPRGDRPLWCCGKRRISVTPRAVILVEGDSDGIALETLATRLGRDLAAERVELISMRGVTNVGAYLQRFATNLSVVVMCDERESASVRRAAERAGVVHLHVEVCVADLEDELIRALGPAAVEQVIEAEGELGSFRSLQQMPAQRERTVEQQLRRFVGTKSGRKAKYAGLLVDALDLARIPPPLMGVLAYVSGKP